MMTEEEAKAKVPWGVLAFLFIIFVSGWIAFVIAAKENSSLREALDPIGQTEKIREQEWVIEMQHDIIKRQQVRLSRYERTM